MTSKVSPVASQLAASALRTPDRVAVNDERRAVTYEELVGLVGTLARLLVEHLGERRATVGPIPLIVGRDVASVVAILAGHWAGVPFASMDEGLPADAVADLVARLGGPPLAVVARAGSRGRVPAAVPVLEVPTLVEDPVPPQPVQPDDVAMVVFTSGSTGKPKGVVKDWRFLDLPFAPPSTGADTHIAMISSFGSSAGNGRVREIAAGHTVAIVDPTRLDPVGLLERFDREQVSEIPLVPSLAVQMLGRWPEGRRLDAVRLVRTFGEALEWEHVPGLRRLVHPRAQIVASYGATEAGRMIGMTIGPDDALGSGRVPLGHPNFPDLVRLVEVEPDPDAPREIVVFDMVARGYLDTPDLTAARFGVDETGRRWWRSGDLAEIGADGWWRHIGRVDDLVKIRGRLVEPAEPERVLHQIPTVRRAVVLPHTTARGGTRLVAHLELDPDSTLTPREVRRRLAAELAPHLVPSPLVRHPRVPLNAHGKIDRVGLRTAAVDPWRDGTLRGPRDDLERAVVVACAEILELDELSLDDDLWELGLDSLAAVELTAACSELGFGSLEPDAPLEHPTPAALAAQLRRAARRGPTSRASTVVVLNDGGDRVPVVCLPGSGSTAVVYHWLARALGADQPVLVIEPEGLHTSGRPDRTIAAAAARTARTVQAAIPEGPLTLVGHSAGGLLALEAARHLDAAGRAVQVVLLDTSAPGSAPDAGARPDARRRSPWARLTGRSPVQLLRRAGFLLHARVLGRFPGRPRPLAARHLAFVHIAARSLRGYRAEPVPCTVTLLQTPGSGAAGTWGSILPGLDSRLVPGTHLSLLHPPHVNDLAAEIADIHRTHVAAPSGAPPLRRVQKPTLDPGLPQGPPAGSEPGAEGRSCA